MIDETSDSVGDQLDSATTGGERRRRRRSHGVRVGVGVAAVVAVLALGGAVAFAVGDDDDDADQASGSHGTGHAHDDAEAMSELDTTSLEATAAAAPGGGHHDHEPLPPYEQRQAGATPDEQAAADDLLADVRATLAAYEDVDAAVAAGYEAPAQPRSALRHHLDRSAAQEGHVLDPNRPNGLVYTTAGGGDPVLIGAYFVALPGVEAPTPAGDLAMWHSHSPSCPGFLATEEAPCTDTRRMLHVWTADQIELRAPRLGRTVELPVVDPFGTPVGAAVGRGG